MQVVGIEECHEGGIGAGLLEGCEVLYKVRLFLHYPKCRKLECRKENDTPQRVIATLPRWRWRKMENSNCPARGGHRAFGGGSRRTGSEWFPSSPNSPRRPGNCRGPKPWYPFSRPFSCCEMRRYGGPEWSGKESMLHLPLFRPHGCAMSKVQRQR